MYLTNTIVLLLLTFCGGDQGEKEDIIIEIPDGKLRGNVESTVAKKVFYAFQGVRYATPPLGRLRFQAPQPVKPWDDIYDATYDKHICYQAESNNDKENEDCLFLNVYAPRDHAEDLPVMVWIYGDAFLNGAAETNVYGPHHLMEYDVVLVTVNYRMGAFGFLSTGDDEIPGNAGLKDQTLALQWVQKNIKYFGGDPDKVTIFGQCAGAASVGYHILSPKSTGLFRAGIAESASPLSPWAMQRRQVELTYKTAGLINPAYDQPGVSSTRLLRFLQNVPAEKIDEAQASLVETDEYDNNQYLQGFYYAPVLEHDHPGAFITKLQYESLAKGEFNRVPLMTGFNSEEALFFTDHSYKIDWMTEHIDNDHTVLVPNDMHIQIGDTVQKTGDEINRIYVPDSSFQDNPAQLVKYLSDDCFIKAVIKHAQLQSAYTDVYFYRFAYHGELGSYTNHSVPGFSDQVRHTEELPYLFSRNVDGFNNIDVSVFPADDVVVQKRLLTLFTNFAKYLNPTPHEDTLLEDIIWPKLNTNDMTYIDIGSYSLLKQHPRAESIDQWEKIYEAYGVPPYDTY